MARFFRCRTDKNQYFATLNKIFLLVWLSDQTYYSPKSNYLEGKWIKLRTTHGWCEEKENKDNIVFLAKTDSLIHYVKYRKCSLLFICSYTTYYAYYRLWRCSGKALIELHVLQVEPKELICTKCSSLPEHFPVFIYHLLAWKRSLTAFKSQKINSSAVHQRSLCSLFLKFLY